jgi:abequosyltransferase
MTIRLSICIPTYNRAALLRETLESIYVQSREELEVVVCDNASSDETEHVVSEYREKFQHLTYYRWPENMGFDRNILKVVEIASGEHCWLLGDDDQLGSNALDHVFPLLDKGLDLMYLNAMSYDSAMKTPSNPILGVFDCADADQTLMSLASWITFISSLCVRRSEFMRYCETGVANVGSGFAHCYPLLHLIRNGRSFIVAEALVKFRAGNTGGYNIFKVFIKEFEMVMDYAASIGFSHDAVVRIKVRNVYAVIIPALIQIKTGRMTLKADRAFEFLSGSGIRFRDKVVVLLLAWCPSIVYDVLKLLKKRKVT